MHDRPTADELLRAVELALDEQFIPTLDGARKYNARVASNVIKIVRRELEHEERHLQAEWLGLDYVLGVSRPPVGAPAMKNRLRERNEELVEEIRAGAADDGEFRTLVLAHVRDTVAAKLEVSNPRWVGE